MYGALCSAANGESTRKWGGPLHVRDNAPSETKSQASRAWYASWQQHAISQRTQAVERSVKAGRSLFRGGKMRTMNAGFLLGLVVGLLAAVLLAIAGVAFWIKKWGR